MTKVGRGKILTIANAGTWKTFLDCLGEVNAVESRGEVKDLNISRSHFKLDPKKGFKKRPF